MATEGIDVDAYTSPFMLTKSMQRDVYPAVDPFKNPELRADNKVVLITGGAGGIGFVSRIMALCPIACSKPRKLTIFSRQLQRPGAPQEQKASF